MPKRSPHPHVAWRDGRPRFSPGPELRVAGHKGKDLLHPDGRWFTFGEVVDWSRSFVATLAPSPKPAVHPQKKGYVYFLWAGDRVKIGFSTNPAMRVAGLMTGVSNPIRFLAVVEGTRADEAALHAKLGAGHRSQGEWFKATRTVVRLMQQCIEAGIGPLAKTGD